MLKITCLQCGKSFIWTDDMPLEGKCPAEDCRWRYDVRRELKRNVEKKTAGSDDKGPCCPVCGRPVGRGWSFCGNCGLLILGSRSIPKRHLIALLIVVLAALSLLAKYLL